MKMHYFCAKFKKKFCEGNTDPTLYPSVSPISNFWIRHCLYPT